MKTPTFKSKEQATQSGSGKGKPTGIARKQAKGAATLFDKLAICEGGLLFTAGALQDEYGLLDLARNIVQERHPDRARAIWFEKFADSMLEAAKNLDVGFFERMAKACKRTHEVKNAYPDAKGAAIIRFLIARSYEAYSEEGYESFRAGKCPTISSEQILNHLSPPDFSYGVIEGSKVRQICRALGIKLPFVPGSIPVGCHTPATVKACWDSLKERKGH